MILKAGQRLIYGLLAAFFLCFSSCGTREALFDVNSKTDFRIELGMSILATHNFVKGNVSIPLNASIDNLGLKDEDISEIVPFRAVLIPKFGDEINLDFINAVNVFIIDPDVLKRKEIFYMDFVRIGDKVEIELLPTLLDISDLVVNDRAILEISVELRQFPPISFDMRLQMQFSGFAEQ